MVAIVAVVSSSRSRRTKAMDNLLIEKAASLWQEYARARQALLAEGIVRSFKSPEADFSEWLIAVLFGGRLPSSKSNRGYDVVTSDKRIQVKSIAKASDNKNGYIIDDQKDRGNNPKTGATHYAFVLFDELIPDSVFLVPEDFVRNFRKKQIKRSDLEKTNFKIDIDLSVFKV
jgi:hypothetical protein